MNEEPDRPVEIIGNLTKVFNPNKTDEYIPSLDVLDLLSFLPDDILLKTIALTSWKRLYYQGETSKLKRIPLKAVVKGDFTKFKLPQYVAELNGIAIPAMLECKVRSSSLALYTIVY